MTDGFILPTDGSSPVGRSCGDCQLCCKLVPVKELSKPAGQKCPWQRFGKGCTIYATRPLSCRVWSCVWFLGGENAGDLRRPDHSHYVVDPMPDFVVARSESGEQLRVEILQVWLDPAYPTAYRDQALYDLVEKFGVPALIRTSNTAVAVILFPPSCSPTGDWWERHPESGDVIAEREHTAEEIWLGREPA